MAEFGGRRFIAAAHELLTIRAIGTILIVSALSSTAAAQRLPLSDLEQLTDRISIRIDRFTVSGENPLDSQSTQQLLSGYLGSDKGVDDIEAAADALESRYRDLGHSFYRVSFPPQELTDGDVELFVRRYQIDKIIVKGNNHYSTRNIKASTPLLKPGASPSTAKLARSLTLANQNSGKRTRLTLASSREDGKIDATLKVVDQNPLVLSAWTNNTGTDASGNYRIGGNISHRNLFDRDHVGSFTMIRSPTDLDEVEQYAASYRLPVYQAGGSISLFAIESNVDSGTVDEFFEVAGGGQIFGIGYSQILPKKDEYRHQLTAQGSDKFFDNDITFEGTDLVTDVRSRPLEISYQSNWKITDNLEVTSSLSRVSNLSGGSDNSDTAYDLSRTGAERNWSKWNLASRVQYSRNDWLYNAALLLSESNDRLITGEQFAVGGSNSIRGMDERELRGDKGLQLNLELWAPPIRKSLRPILFFDFGRVEVNSAIDGEIDAESVASLGIKLNWNPTPSLNTSLAFGYLMDGIDAEEAENVGLSADGDNKLHFSLTYRY